MGANQSSQSPAQPQESLYEILGVEPNANEADLKKAYKKKALQLHPDRNYANVDEATKEFAKVQAAYDVLSDAQERAWYDHHGTMGAPGHDQDDSVYGGKVTRTEDLKQYFEPEAYIQSEEEFYIKINQLFDQLRQEESEAAMDSGEEPPILPRFGGPDDNWVRATKPFYDAWSSFASIKSFSWEDVYRVWDTPDRRTRRAAEQRNKRIRDAARKEFNSTVRQLVTIVRAKDPRVKRNRREVEDNKNKLTSINKSEEQARRDRKAQMERRGQYQQQDWERVDPDAEKQYEEVHEEEVEDLYECVVCDKVFKTKRQFKSHETSKKHIRSVKQLQREMRKEGIELGFDEDSESESESESENGEHDKSVAQVDISASESDEKNMQESKKAEPVKDEGKDSEDSEAERKEEEGGIEQEEQEEHANKEPTLEELLAQLEGTRINKKASDDEVPVKGKAKQKRQKKTKQAGKNDFANTCTVCQTEFASRNKLFDHVKVSGHALAPQKGKKK